MKQLIAKLLLVVVVVLSAFSPIVAGVPAATQGAHAYNTHSKLRPGAGVTAIQGVHINEGISRVAVKK